MKRRKIWIILIVPILILAYLLTCLGFFFFEPISYHAPDLSADAKYSFDQYQNFAYKKNNSFYIRTLTPEDIEESPDDPRMKYVDNTIMAIADESATFSQISSLASDCGATVTGYIEVADFYQFTFSELSYFDILKRCSDMEKSDLIEVAFPDYFEETPLADTDDEATSINNAYYYSMIHAQDAWKYAENAEPIIVGTIDEPVDYNNPYMTVINQDLYSTDCFEDLSYGTSHGTHVAGIIGASPESESPGICPNAQIYSYNGVSISLSFLIAAFADMITQQNVKVINISMGYNSYIPISASLGCEATIDFIRSENDFMATFFDRLIDNGYDFLICVAAGNTNGKSLYKTASSVFGYSEKTILRKLDKLNLFSDKPEYCDAAYSFLLTDIQDEDIRRHIVIVGSCDEKYRYSEFSNAGKSVDLVAPGENIYSTTLGNEYGYASGTSMATPFVSGTAALLYSLDSSLTAKEVKDILIQSASQTVSAYGFTYPVLDSGAAAQYVTEKKR